LNLKIDENMPLECAAKLRQAGFSVDTVLDEGLSGTDDTALLQICQRESRILLTLDLDFADIRSYPPGTHAGIVVLRPESQDQRSLLSMTERLLSVLREKSARSELWIVEPSRIRIREK
jgi:predicted nuclease of predicted toxin-antitoxin system